MAFTQKELDRMERIYGDTEVEPTDPQELRRFLAWKKQGSKGPMPEVRPKVLDAFYLDIIKGKKDPKVRTATFEEEYLPSLADAAIQMLSKEHEDGWDKAIKILYGKGDV
jgi:hypothetical protein